MIAVHFQIFCPDPDQQMKRAVHYFARFIQVKNVQWKVIQKQAMAATARLECVIRCTALDCALLKTWCTPVHIVTSVQKYSSKVSHS